CRTRRTKQPKLDCVCKLRSMPVQAFVFVSNVFKAYSRAAIPLKYSNILVSQEYSRTAIRLK
ncbi:hypothetical protein GBA52_018131, partial [Prunus armeniaca]